MTSVAPSPARRMAPTERPPSANEIQSAALKESLKRIQAVLLESVSQARMVVELVVRRHLILLERLLGLPGLLGRAMRQLASSRPARFFMLVAASVVCISLRAKRQSGATVQVSSSLSLLFGMVKLQGTLNLQLGRPKYDLLAEGGGAGQGEELRISCPPDLKDHIVRFLENQAARNPTIAPAWQLTPEQPRGPAPATTPAPGTAATDPCAATATPRATAAAPASAAPSSMSAQQPHTPEDSGALTPPPALAPRLRMHTVATSGGARGTPTSGTVDRDEANANANDANDVDGGPSHHELVLAAARAAAAAAAVSFASAPLAEDGSEDGATFHECDPPGSTGAASVGGAAVVTSEEDEEEERGKEGPGSAAPGGAAGVTVAAAGVVVLPPTPALGSSPVQGVLAGACGVQNKDVEDEDEDEEGSRPQPRQQPAQHLFSAVAPGQQQLLQPQPQPIKTLTPLHPNTWTVTAAARLPTPAEESRPVGHDNFATLLSYASSYKPLLPAPSAASEGAAAAGGAGRTGAAGGGRTGAGAASPGPGPLRKSPDSILGLRGMGLEGWNQSRRDWERLHMEDE